MRNINGINAQVIKEYLEKSQGYIIKNPLVVLIAVACTITLLITFFILSNSGSYIALDASEDEFSEFNSPKQLASWLKNHNYKYKWGDDNKIIYVDYEDYPKIHKALNLSNSGVNTNKNLMGFELLDNSSSFGSSQFMESIRYRRALEGELARTISGMSNIKSARVHLAIPKKSAFLRDITPSSASVFIKTDSSEVDSSLIDSIINLVATSISGMKPEHVTVVDQYGALLSDDSNKNNQLTLPIKQEKTKLKYQKLIEKEYTHEIKKILTPLLGNNDYKIALDINLKFIKANTKAQNLEDIINTKYGNLKITNVTTMVLLPSKIISNSNGTKVFKPFSKHEIDKIKKLISTVIPFEKSRGDIVLVDNLVTNTSIINNPDELHFANFKLLKAYLKKNYLSIVGSLLGLLFLYLVFRKIKYANKSKSNSSNNLKDNKEKLSEKENNFQKEMSIDKISDQELFNSIKNSHIQVQTVILAIIEPFRSSNLLIKYNDAIKFDIITKFFTLSKINKVTLDKIYHVIENKLKFKIVKQSSFEGIEIVLQIIFFMKFKDKNIINKLSKYNEKIGAEINKRIFNFENLAFLTDVDLKVLLKKVSQDDLFYALKSSDPIMSNKIINNLEPDKAKDLREKLESYHPVKISEAEKAQDEILKIFANLIINKKLNFSFVQQRKVV